MHYPLSYWATSKEMYMYSFFVMESKVRVIYLYIVRRILEINLEDKGVTAWKSLGTTDIDISVSFVLFFSCK